MHVLPNVCASVYFNMWGRMNLERKCNSIMISVKYSYIFKTRWREISHHCPLTLLLFPIKCLCYKMSYTAEYTIHHPAKLTHCFLVPPCGDIDLVNIGPGNGLVPSSMTFCGIHHREISQKMFNISILDIRLKITDSRLQPPLSGANDSNVPYTCPEWFTGRTHKNALSF